MSRHLLPALALAASLTLAGFGCDGEQTAAPADTAETGASTASLPADLILTDAPEGAQGVSEVRGAAAEGERVVMRGVIAGRPDPIAENRAIFTLLDESIQTCDKNPADACQTPWDACCEPQDTIAANAATVQVVDAEGRPLETGLAGAAGLKPLSRVTVVGTFEPSPDGQAAMVNATGIFVDG